MAQDPNTRKAAPDDLPDSASDAARLQPEVTYIDLPDVSDIPGQEHVHPAPLGELADVTISSDDEEGILNADSDDAGFFSGEPADDEEQDTAGIP